ncbi:hypothetical protein E5288_WYG009861 [Bos mutus]|uniref:Alpha-S1-casein n=8 Tax=Bovinae TaxID=27592 RepID=A0A6B0RR40_9CETA|nr:hypothetical protein [Bos mutus]
MAWDVGYLTHLYFHPHLIKPTKAKWTLKVKGETVLDHVVFWFGCAHRQLKTRQAPLLPPGSGRQNEKEKQKKVQEGKQDGGSESKILTTMKLLILTCLVAVALARPPFPEVFGKEKVNELSKDQAMEDIKQKHIQKEDVPSERYLGYLEIVPNSAEERLHSMKEGIHAQQVTTRYCEICAAITILIPIKSYANFNHYCYLVNLMRIVYVSYVLEEILFRQFYQLDAYPSGAWYYVPLGTQYTDAPSFSDIPNPIGSENSGKTTMPLWWNIAP